MILSKEISNNYSERGKALSIYMDNAATTHLSDAAYRVYIDALHNCNGNASSAHSDGFAAFCALSDARERISSMLSCHPEQIIFTSGGSESDNLAIMSCAAYGEKCGKRHIVASSIEHHAVLEPLRYLESNGFSVSYVVPREDGIVDVNDVISSIREDTAFITVMYANNEIGTIQPIDEIAAECKKRGILFFTDAVQAVGHIEISLDSVNIDMMSMSAHKFHGPKGTGVLYVKDRNLLSPIIRGGMQEQGARAGTENVPAIVAMAAALEDSLKDRDTKNAAVLHMRERLIDGLLQIKGAQLNGSRALRLEGNVNVSIENVGAEQLVLLLDSYGIAVSSGSACTARFPAPSHVLTSIGVDNVLASSSIRLTIDEYNTPDEIEAVIETVKDAVYKIRSVR